MLCVIFPVAALFSQVAVLAAVLALVAIIIMSIIILIAVWRKVRNKVTNSPIRELLFTRHVEIQSMVN